MTAVPTVSGYQARKELLMASKQKTDQTVRMATSEQLKQLIAIIVQAIPVRITFMQAQYWIGHAKELAAKIREIFAVADPYADQVLAWEIFYAQIFGITVDLSTLKVPDRREGFDRLIIVLPNLTIEQALSACKARFPVWRWTNDDLDKLTESTRSAANGPYAIWIRDRIEADQEHASKSYNDLQKANIPGITLMERLLLELKYFTETGQHLDLQNVTLCAGSLARSWDGQGVPSVGWRDSWLCVYWFSRKDADSDLRSREVVVG